MIIKEILSIKNIDAFLVALVLSVNVLRFFLHTDETTLPIYFVYFVTIFVLFLQYHKQIKMLLRYDKATKIVFFTFFAIILYSAFSLVWINSPKAVVTLLKFSVALIITFLCIALPQKKILYVFYYFIIINIVYSGVILLNAGMVASYMALSVNYLNITLTIGLSLTLAMIGIQESFNNKKNINTLLWFLLSTLFFITLINFIARGVLIFPPIAVLIVMLLKGKKINWRSIIILFVFVVLGYFAFSYFMQHGSDYSTGRFMRLFEDTEGEDRWPIWNLALNIILDKGWYLFGGGIEAFKYNSVLKFYPHNIFIQLWGEYGLWGVFSLVYILVLVSKNTIRSIQSGNKLGLSYSYAGLLYYIMTFSKSFSLYDALPLFIMIVFCLTLSRSTLHVTKDGVVIKVNGKLM